MSTNFGESQWLIVELSAQGGGVRSDPQKGNNTFIKQKTFTRNHADFVAIQHQ
jgi:hypothetical protein